MLTLTSGSWYGRCDHRSQSCKTQEVNRKCEHQTKPLQPALAGAVLFVAAFKCIRKHDVCQQHFSFLAVPFYTAGGSAYH